MTTIADRIAQRAKAKSVNTNNVNARNNDEWTPSEVFLNIGKSVPNADGEAIFVAGLSIPMDNAKMSSFGGSKAQREAIYEQLATLADSLQPGESKVFTIEVEMRRRGEPKALPDDQLDVLDLGIL